MQTMKVKPWGEGQGDYVVIDAAQFDPALHLPFEEPAAKTEETVPEITATAPAKTKTRAAKPAAQE